MLATVPVASRVFNLFVAGVSTFRCVQHFLYQWSRIDASRWRSIVKVFVQSKAKFAAMPEKIVINRRVVPSAKR